jgi:membrane protease YdiL (CAAX protease family)
VIAILKFWLVPADYGLHWPRGKTYILPAVLWAASLAAITTAINDWPLIIAHAKPDMGFPLTPENVWGWTFFESVYVGPTEEIPFRALLVVYLATAMPGKLRIRLPWSRYEMNWAGIIVALVFALAHISSFFTGDWQGALLQQFYAFSIGVLYAYWLEKSKSIVAPIIAHNVSDGLVFVILFVWLGVFKF